MDNIAEIKSKLSIEEVVSEYVSLKKAGRNFKGLCPFHKEKTPSFIVSPEKGLAYCFGCHKGGDMFQFIEELEGVDFPQALEILGKKAGVEVKKEYISEKSKSIKNDVFNAYKETTNTYHNILFSKAGEKALNYIKNRGVSIETIKTFKLGYAPDSFTTLLDLVKKDDKLEGYINAGLIISRDSKTYDRFHDRIIFPINNTQGLPIAFTGRILEKGEPKYLNSPDSVIFNKSNILFGLDKTKKYIKEKGFVIIVEGQMDVLMSYQSDMNNVVATSGTSFTRDHIRLLKRFTDNIVLALDNDTAGLKASFSAIELALSEGMNIEMVKLDQKDPADIVQKDPLNWTEIVKKRIDYFDFWINLFISKVDIKEKKNKDKVISRLLQLIAFNTNSIEVSDMIKRMSISLKIRENDIRDELIKTRNKKTFTNNIPKTDDLEDIKKNKYDKFTFLIAFLNSFPEVRKKNRSKIDKLLEILGQDNENIYIAGNLEYDLKLGEGLQNKDKTKKLQEASKKLAPLELMMSDYYDEGDTESLSLELDRLISNILSSYKKSKLPDLILKIKIAEENRNLEEIKKLQNELINLIKITN